MEVVVGPENCKRPPNGSAVTIGAYDGVHLGHRFVIGELIERARSSALSPVVLTFDRHPATVVRPESAPLELTSLEQKLELLAQTGVEKTVVVPFDEARANETAEDFVNDVLVSALGARLVVVGEDFHFGHGRKGDVGLLREMGRENGFDVLGLQLEPDSNGDSVSSTRIRELLAVGDVEGAARLLGRPYEVRGLVEHGDGRGGSELGFPTANVCVSPRSAMPADGIYAGFYVRPDGSEHMAAISLGVRPTFGEGNVRKLEAFLLDFRGDLLGEEARVSFVTRLRGEERFDSAEALVEQMGRDVARTRELLERKES
ncbi:MAG TPA: bifunctional riboflavin kinase/FAD synthetase [Acidimicrobiales bacterium]|nr:bifunctional riboflavin kinase/FAD synthetase [Acidimicrobiales bacterium]